MAETETWVHLPLGFYVAVALPWLVLRRIANALEKLAEGKELKS